MRKRRSGARTAHQARATPVPLPCHEAFRQAYAGAPDRGTSTRRGKGHGSGTVPHGPTRSNRHSVEGDRRKPGERAAMAQLAEAEGLVWSMSSILVKST